MDASDWQRRDAKSGRFGATPPTVAVSWSICTCYDGEHVVLRVDRGSSSDGGPAQRCTLTLGAREAKRLADVLRAAADALEVGLPPHAADGEGLVDGGL